MSYNILEGGTDRVDALAAVLQPQHPHLVALVEANDPSAVAHLAGLLHMEPVHAPGNGGASALLTHWPIVRVQNHALIHPDFRRSLLEAVVLEPGGREWHLGIVHLSPHATEADESRRERELELVLGVFAAARQAGRPHLLAGDFNSNAPGQQIDPAHCTPHTQRDFAANGGHIPRRVVQRLLDEGYVDTLEAVQGARAMTEGTFSTEHPGQRVDFVFAFGIEPARIRQAWIERGHGARHASDHYPIGVQID